MSTANSRSQMRRSVLTWLTLHAYYSLMYITLMVPHAWQVHQQLFLFQCIAPAYLQIPRKLNTGKTIWHDLSSKYHNSGYSGLLYCALKPAEFQIHAQIIQHQVTCTALSYVVLHHVTLNLSVWLPADHRKGEGRVLQRDFSLHKGQAEAAV